MTAGGGLFLNIYSLAGWVLPFCSSTLQRKKKKTLVSQVVIQGKIREGNVAFSQPLHCVLATVRMVSEKCYIFLKTQF